MEKKYLVFWKCIANADIWDYDTLQNAENVAKDLFTTKHVLEVELIVAEERRIIKTKEDWKKQGSVSGLHS